MLSNCGVWEDSWECLGLKGDQTSQSWRKSTLNIHWKDWCWSWSSNTLATWCKEQTHWKRPWCWERLRAGEGNNRGWDDWMASLTQWTWVWPSSGRWWRTGKPGMLQCMESQSWTQPNHWTTKKEVWNNTNIWSQSGLPQHSGKLGSFFLLQVSQVQNQGVCRWVFIRTL